MYKDTVHHWNWTSDMPLEVPFTMWGLDATLTILSSLVTKSGVTEPTEETSLVSAYLKNFVSDELDWSCLRVGLSLSF